MEHAVDWWSIIAWLTVMAVFYALMPPGDNNHDNDDDNGGE
jgi:hypothetical protein